VESHAEFLRVAALDAELAAAIRRDWRTASITDPERAMLEYVEKLTRAPRSIWKGDLDRLRQAGFDDTAILQINLIASFFAYVNRVADGLGVGRE
jgi:uncharacterized peroxidase-related enzyme